MEVLITLVLFGLTIYLLPYIIGGLMFAVAVTTGAIALIIIGISKLFTR